jgi:hypothetical protein
MGSPGNSPDGSQAPGSSVFSNGLVALGGCRGRQRSRLDLELRQPNGRHRGVGRVVI